MPKPIQTRDLRIFGDESSHTGERDYLTYGTVNCDAKNLDTVVAKLESASGDPSELKWNHLTKRNRGRYLRFATAICDLLNRNGPLWYGCVVIPIRESIYRDNPKKGMRDFVFYNLIMYARDHAVVPAQFTVLLDKGVPFSTADLQDRLNNRDKDEHDKSGRFTSITEGESTDRRLIQAATLGPGVVANANDTDESIESWKTTFAKVVARLANIPLSADDIEMQASSGVIWRLSD